LEGASHLSTADSTMPTAKKKANTFGRFNSQVVGHQPWIGALQDETHLPTMAAMAHGRPGKHWKIDARLASHPIFF
jgi:hypothetical protein